METGEEYAESVSDLLTKLEFRDGTGIGFGLSSSNVANSLATPTSSKPSGPESLLPTSSSVPTAAAVPAQPKSLGNSSQSDLLRVSVVTARGLALPPGQVLRPQQQTSEAKPTLRQRQMNLPYVVLEFDKNEVLILGSGGDLMSPQWQFTANFDVSRHAEVMLHVYLRAEMVTNVGTPPPDAFGGVSRTMPGAMRPTAADLIGGSDVYLGMAKLAPPLESGRTVDTWLPLINGAGEIRVQMAFKSQQGKSLSIETFELLKVIGKGSFGKVMQVRKRDTSRIYALKIIRKAHIISRSEVTHTLAERTVLAQVNSPFIVPLKFSFQSPDKLYLGLAFVNGGELFLHLQREGRFSEGRSRFYAAELFCALEHLHSFNVIYRDLKPENILLDYTGHIALCDFGLCKLNMGDKETTHTFCGTPEYLAPELLLGNGYTKSVDWWTLGVLLYEMLTGLPPFYSEDVNEMYRKILHEPLMFPPDVRPDARDLLTRLLRRNPYERLGYGAHGAAEIKNHPFFTKHLDWNQLLAKKVQPPYKPGVASAFDTSNFDPEFTNEPALDSVVDDSHMISAAVQEQFAGFSYNAAADGATSGSLWS